MMEEICAFLKQCETYYLATVEGDQPRVRPFGTAHIFEEHLYFQTGKVKQVSKQLLANPNVELCGMAGGKWVRVAGTAVEDGRPTPQLWSLERGRGRVFVSIPGHYSWTFDDPLFRVLLLRGIAWAAKEPVDRFNDLVWPGADVAR